MASMSFRLAAAFVRWLKSAHEGNAGIEFALIAPLFLVMAIGGTDFGMQFYTALSVESAARSGMQMLAIDPADTVGAQTAALKASSLDPSDVAVNVTKSCECPDGTSASCTGTCATGGDVQISYLVEVTTNYTRILSYPGLKDTVPLTGRAQLRVR